MNKVLLQGTKHTPQDGVTIEGLNLQPEKHVGVTIVFSRHLSDAELDEAKNEFRNFAAESQTVECNSAHLGRLHLKFVGSLSSFSKLFNTSIGHYRRANGHVYHAPADHLSIPAALEGKLVFVVGLNNDLKPRRIGAQKPMRISPKLSPSFSVTPPYPATQIAEVYNFPAGDGTGQRVGIVELGGGYLQSDLIQSFANNGVTPPAAWMGNNPTQPNPVSVDGGTNQYYEYVPHTTTPFTNIGTVTATTVGSQTTVTFDPGLSGATFTSDMVDDYFAIDGQPLAKVKQFISSTELIVESYSDPITVVTPTTFSIITSSSGEVALDIDIIAALVPNAYMNVYFSPPDSTSFYDCIAAAVANNDVVSISWGLPEADDTSSPTFSSKVQELLLAYPNVTVLGPAGDDGSTDGTTDPTELSVDAPGNCPNMISCGATSITLSDPTTISTEVVWNNATGTTGGGFSKIFTLMPSYQNGIVTGSGRGCPDISANGDVNTGYIFVIYGTDLQGGGTSTVAPLFASLFVRMNQSLGHNLGFANPALYEHIVYSGPNKTYNDITVGNNVVSSDPALNFYYAGVGWDAASGIGSVNGQNLLNAIHCLRADTLIMLEDGDEVPVCMIKRGDVVRGASSAGSTSTKNLFKVARLSDNAYHRDRAMNLYIFHPGSLGPLLPSQPLCMTEWHSIIYEGARRTAKCFRNFPNVEVLEGVRAGDYLPIDRRDGMCHLYNLQYETEGTHTANGVCVQSMSPCFIDEPLEKSLFYDSSLYREERTHDTIDHPIMRDNTVM